jgi:hypothetical protein
MAIAKTVTVHVGVFSQDLIRKNTKILQKQPS